ncbi:iron ABC transporter permease [Psychrosphaera sp. F3M07]|uniref:ABC transporter permease n=1 Tax=Psychrosphaera sp. F3M07 TaxID=2841560 RepID=UPI001C097CA4|nr:iron ABC transporter permease [Psychrosphaera sp. F3M07]MBU2916652.1 iron ABC transporter permease [Psychrosphaera sp. F3M07]
MRWPSFKHIKISSLLLALCMALPLLTLLFEALSTHGDSFTHIKETVLTDYVINTVLLMASVGFLVLLIGIPLAWLIANCEFWGKRFFNWALVLPLAMPAYLVAYTYTDLLDYAGPIQITLRDWFGWTSINDYWFFDIRSLSGAAIMLSLVLYPYVYLMVRASFLEQNATLTHAARVLGKSPFKCFMQVSLPLARTAIIASCALAMMESMADFATVNYFAVSTLTTAVYDTWLGHYDLASAAKLSAIMVMGIFVLLFLEQLQKGRQKNSNDAKVSQQTLSYKLSTKQTVLAVSFCSLILFLAFIVPVVILLQYAIHYFEQSWTTEVFDFALNSAGIALITALLALVLSLILNYTYRVKPTKAQSFSLKVASSGYAIPGTVMAIGVLIPLTFLDTQINDMAVWMGLSAPGLLLSGTVIAIIFAHLVRFIAIANKTLESSYEKISPSLDMVSKTMGTNGVNLLRKVHIPLIRKSALVAALLIFVESMKELPAALLLRPFDFQTLPTYVYQFASDEQLELAALGAILIVLVGLIPLLVLNRSIDAK